MFLRLSEAEKKERIFQEENALRMKRIKERGEKAREEREREREERRSTPPIELHVLIEKVYSLPQWFSS